MVSLDLVHAYFGDSLPRGNFVNAGFASGGTLANCTTERESAKVNATASGAWPDRFHGILLISGRFGCHNKQHDILRERKSFGISPDCGEKVVRNGRDGTRRDQREITQVGDD